MDGGREDRIRAKAHALWEADGKPDGKERTHWEQAAKLVDEEERAAARRASDPDAASPRDPAASDGPIGVTIAAMKKP